MSVSSAVRVGDRCLLPYLFYHKSLPLRVYVCVHGCLYWCAPFQSNKCQYAVLWFYSNTSPGYFLCSALSVCLPGNELPCSFVYICFDHISNSWVMGCRVEGSLRHRFLCSIVLDFLFFSKKTQQETIKWIDYRCRVECGGV